MSLENDLHDWYIDGIIFKPPEITLLVHFYEAKKKIKFSGVTRCLLDNLLMTNIIYAAKIVSATEDAEFYQQELERLDASYSASWRKGIAPNILSVSTSIGLDGIIEFNDLEVVDL